eukprot:295030-Chlamydomonas_euryale.AAC.4
MHGAADPAAAAASTADIVAATADTAADPASATAAAVNPAAAALTLTCPVSLADATHFPSGLNLTCRTADPWPLNVASTSRPRRSHTLTLVSMEPDTRPYWDSSRHSTLERWPDMARVTASGEHRGDGGWRAG